MHRHSTDAVIQFIQMEYICPENFTKWAISGGDIYLCIPPIIAGPVLYSVAQKSVKLSNDFQ